jgi:hypothetical protein
MPYRHRSPGERIKAHDWQHEPDSACWVCPKCGARVGRGISRGKKPSIYARFEGYFLPDGTVNMQRIKVGRGMLCDEIITWKVMES